MKIAWLTDTHFAATGNIAGHDPRVRLDAAITHINDHHGEADLCVISGDLADRGVEDQYLAMKRHLDRLCCRYLLLVGNHDAREPLKSAFGAPADCMEGFMQYSVNMPDGRIICLDTLRVGHEGGEFCEARADWLDSRLRAEPDRPTYLFMHHPPMPLGLPMLDEMNLREGGRFIELIAGHRNVRHLFIGHVHRPICGTVSGIPFATMRSTLYQAPPPKPDWNWDTFAPAREAPNLGILTIQDGDVNLQYTQFCGYEVGT